MINLLYWPLLFSMPGPLEVALIVLVILLLFGARKLPEMAKGFGQAIKEFKKAISGSDKKPGEKEE